MYCLSEEGRNVICMEETRKTYNLSVWKTYGWTNFEDQWEGGRKKVKI